MEAMPRSVTVDIYYRHQTDGPLSAILGQDLTVTGVIPCTSIAGRTPPDPRHTDPLPCRVDLEHQQLVLAEGLPRDAFHVLGHPSAHRDQTGRLLGPVGERVPRRA